MKPSPAFFDLQIPKKSGGVRGSVDNKCCWKRFGSYLAGLPAVVHGAQV